jgi:hypothetical protein
MVVPQAVWMSLEWDKGHSLLEIPGAKMNLCDTFARDSTRW